jgi:hypothetical protein
MGNGRSANGRPSGEDGPVEAITAALRELAYTAWAASREPEQDSSNALFERTYLGHYSAVDAYVTGLIDGYQLDAKLDAAIAQPFRRHLDINVTALGQDLVASGTLYALPAFPVGVWVFNGEIG